MENGPVEIVDFPMKNGGSFHDFPLLFVCSPEGIDHPKSKDLTWPSMARFFQKDLCQDTPGEHRLRELRADPWCFFQLKPRSMADVYDIYIYL